MRIELQDDVRLLSVLLERLEQLGDRLAARSTSDPAGQEGGLWVREAELRYSRQRAEMYA